MNAETMVGKASPDMQDRTARWARIPQALRDRPQWALAGPDKAPRTASGGNASSTDPSTWTDFQSACAAAAERGWHIGYMLHADDPFTCVDLDVCDADSQVRKGQPIDPTQWTKPEAIEGYRAGVSHFDSYAEQSANGKGFHIWLIGSIGPGRKRDGVEVYSQDRFIVCTGDVVWDRPIAERPAQLTTLLDSMRTPVESLELPPDPADAEADWYVADIAANDTGEMGALFRGEWQGKYPSQSEADLALVKMLARLTESNRECWSAFRMSALGKREKAARADYMKRTLSLARAHLANDAAQLAHGQQIASAIIAGTRTHDPRHFRLLNEDDLRHLAPQRWLVKGIIPDASIGTIFGQSGTFKSFLTLDLMAHVANGVPWFGKRVIAAPAVYVPFEGKGGIPKRVAAWRTAKMHQHGHNVVTNMRFITEPMNLRNPLDRDKLVATLTENGWAGGILCIDTLAQAGVGIDENSSEGMGEMIGIFQELQRRLGGVVLVVHHEGKQSSAGMRGWSGLRGALDFSIKCQRDEDEGKSKLDAQFVLDKVKDGEDGLTFNFSMLRVHLGYDADGDEMSSLTVAPPVVLSFIEQLTAPPTEAQRDEEDEQFIYEWVKREVADGKFPSGTSLDNQLADMKEQGRAMMQKRVRGAVARLKAKSKLAKAATKSPSGNDWLRAVDDLNTPAST
jgi:hypothetical protein